MQAELGLSAGSIVADIGSGTGILSELFLKNGNFVFGVEPNHEMRKAAENILREYTGFYSLSGRAEETGLDRACVDFITAGQSFHWFDLPRARAEFKRILRPDGWVILIWNVRDSANSAFMKAFQEIVIRYGSDYKSVHHGNVGDDEFRAFFGNYGFRAYDNYQTFNYQGLEGRLLSSSYTPLSGDQNYEPMIQALRKMYDDFQENGKITFPYQTHVFFGQLK